MPKIPPALTVLTIENLKPKKSPYTKPDGAGLHLRVMPSGLKSWLSRYKDNEGKRGMVVIGQYPIMSLADARQKNEAVQLQAAKSKDAIVSYREEKKISKLGKDKETLEQERLREEAKKRSFTVISELWLEEYRIKSADQTYSQARQIVRNYLQVGFGNEDIATLGRFTIEGTLLSLASSAPAQASKAVNYIRQIIDYAIQQKVREEYTELNLNNLTKRIPKGGHYPAITNPKDLIALLDAIDNYDGVYVKNALKLCLWTAHRPYVVASAQWSEIDLEQGVWLVRGYDESMTHSNGQAKRRMKMGVDHIVSLPDQAVEMLKAMRLISGDSEYVFPKQHSRSREPHISRDSLSKALRSMGFAGMHCTHGFRALMRTIAREEIEAEPDVLEAQLAHAKKSDSNRGAYDRTFFTKKRRDAMQEWADYLDGLRANNRPLLKVV